MTCHGIRRRWLAVGAAVLMGLSAHGQVLINEFMALNGSTLKSALDNTFPDWIEFYNSGAAAVDLNRWCLKDSANLWRFPSVIIPAGGYLLVLADGKDGFFNGQLHAPLSLNEAGEPLVLLRPDGKTVESAYFPSFPAQVRDVSYGLLPAMENLDLVLTNTSYRYWAPLNGTVDTTWMNPTQFNDSAWLTGTAALGAEVGGTTNFTDLIRTRIVPFTKPPFLTGVYVRYAFSVPGVGMLDTLVLRACLDDGMVVYLNGTKVLTVNASQTVRWDSMASSARDNLEARGFEEFDLANFRSLLVSGTNVLAVHVLSFTERSPDLFFWPELKGGRFKAGTSSLQRYFHEPTPGAANQLGTLDFVHPPLFSVPRGYYTTPFSLVLSSGPDYAEIWYTLDGTVPVQGEPSLRYSQPLRIDGSRVVRARAFREGYEPSTVASHTYLFIDDIVAQPMLRVEVTSDPTYGPKVREALLAARTLSMVGKAEDIISGPTAIYNNPNSTGEAWERGVSIEWIDPADVGGGTQLDCGVRIYGGASRGAAKKNFRFIFKKKYGPTRLEYALFPDDPSATKQFETIILRATSNDSLLNCGFVDAYNRQTQADIAGVGSRSTFVHLFINGVYWGLYNPSERCDQAFSATYSGGERDQWDGVNAGEMIGGSPSESWLALQAGSRWAGDACVAYMRLQGLNPDGTPNPSYPVLLDVDQHIDYILVQMATSVGDWPGHNWYAGAPTRVPGRMDGWKFYCWDTEFSIYSYGINLNTDNTGTYGPLSIFGFLATCPDFRIRVADHVYQHLVKPGGVFTYEKCLPRFLRLRNMVELPNIASHARWGSLSTIVGWKSTVDGIVQNYLPNRPAVFLQQLRNRGLYPRIDPPEFSLAGGTFSDPVDLVMTAAAGLSIYYTTDGTDPRALGGGIRGQLYTKPVWIANTAQVMARAHSSSQGWSALQKATFIGPDLWDSVRVSEVMYHPHAPPTNSVYTSGEFEFLEVVNRGSQPGPLGFVKLNGGVHFQFPAQSLAPGGYAVVVKNLEAFYTRYGSNTVPVLGEYTGSLKNSGDRVRLETMDGGVELVSFEYGDSRAWPLAADGAGHSLVPLEFAAQSSGLLNYGGNWRASTYRGGSPGRVDPAPVQDVVLNEFMAHTDVTNVPGYESNDWLELYNRSGSGVTLTNWYLSDDASELQKWGIPGATVLQSMRFAVFDEITGFHVTPPAGFGLSKDGEQLFLSYLAGSANDRVADCVRFKAQENGRTLGRFPDGGPGWYPLIPTPGATNSRAPREVFISEILYHPAEVLQGAGNEQNNEFVEIFNPLNTPVSLMGEVGPWRISGGVEYTFPTNTVLPALGYLVVVPFDPVANPTVREQFLTTYGVPGSQVRLLGPYQGQLSDRGDRVALERSQAPDLPGDPTGWVIVDEVVYFDQAPWPAAADGTGRSLQRLSGSMLGTDPGAWTADSAGTPGLGRPRIAVTFPQNDSSFFIPFSQRVTVSLDEAYGPVRPDSVEFWVNGSRMFVDSTPPFEWRMDTVTAPGLHELFVRMTEGAATNVSTVVRFHALSVSNGGGVSNITDSAAELGGELKGSGQANLMVFWGASDGGTNRSAWGNSCTVGIRGQGVFSVKLQQLVENRRYYYRCAAYNAQGDSSWAPGTLSFRTKPSAGWSKRMQIRFPGYGRSSVLTNFPVLILLSTNIPGFSYTDFGFADGRDLRFVDSQEQSFLSYEVEQWAPTGTSRVWVRVPELAGTNTTIYAYWGNPGSVTVPDFARDGSVWDSSFATVAHFARQYNDSTHNHADIASHYTAFASAMIGDGIACNGTNAYVNVGIHYRWLTENLRNLTVSCWVRPASDRAGSVFGIDNPVNTNSLFFTITRQGWRGVVKFAESNVHSTDVGKWQLLTLILDRNQAYATWNDGPRLALGAYPDFTLDYTLTFGDKNGKSSPFDGLIDEARLSSVVRPADWVWAEYRTVASNASFSSYSPAPFSRAPQLNNTAATDVQPESACLNGVLSRTSGVETLVSIFWGPADGGVVKTAWAHETLLGPREEDAFSIPVTNLLPAQRYYYRGYATNFWGEAWAGGTESFSTPARLPVVEAFQPIAGLTATSAVLNAELKSAGGASTRVRVYWGSSDGGTRTSAWEQVTDLGVQPEGPFSAPLQPLTPGQQYYYRGFAENSAGQGWTAASGTFSTPAWAFQDLDRDGLADSWEQRYFGGTNVAAGAPGQDADRDGQLNREEYVAGTDPMKPEEFFSVEVEPLADGKSRVWFDTRSATGVEYDGLARYYSLESRTSLVGVAWSGIEGRTNLPGTGMRVEYTNSEATVGFLRFYRGRVWLERLFR